MKLSLARAREGIAARLASGLVLLAAVIVAGWLAAPAPAAAQWGDSYDRPSGGGYDNPRRRARDSYYRDDGSGGRRYAPQQEAPRQFYWPWEERPQQAEPRPRPQPTYRPAQPPRPRPSISADSQRSRVRREKPAAAPEPPKPVAAKTEPTTQIAVFGDSLADHLSRGLDDVFEDNQDVVVIDRAKGDSGLVRLDVVDWPKAAEEYLKANPKVSYALVMLGVNDRQPIREGDQSYEPLGAKWKEIYAARIDAMAKVFAERKIPLIWVGTPPVRGETLTAALASINDIARERVTKAGATYVDVWPGFTDDRNRYAPSGPDLEGQIAKLRTSDGVHFTHAGARKLAHFADVELKRLMGTAAPNPVEQQPAAAVSAAPSGPSLGGAPKLDDTAAIDRQITAMLPSLPEPAGIPALPVKPAAGPVVPLGRPEISPGGILTSGRPFEADPSGTVERSLQRGAAPLPQPGRADDFRWPPG
ncbi:SGNH/GDSL hydrolase family protein [Methylobacterium sp. sgz302541]|uniref:SGNH/GDSL hydrolase family protein n=1 Tax=unclassified Methylobacterium TaxID=2615210 RepID=UPI003D3380C0